MKGIDTQLLLYALNVDCAEHARAQRLLGEMAAEPQAWVVADQVLFELYRLLRNPVVLQKPLGAAAAAGMLAWFDQAGFHRVAYTHDLWSAIRAKLATKNFPAKRTFDVQLAHTLRANGVDTLYTHNRKDFLEAGFRDVIDPLKD